MEDKWDPIGPNEEDQYNCLLCLDEGCEACEDDRYWTQQTHKVGTASHHPECICNACRGFGRPPE